LWYGVWRVIAGEIFFDGKIDTSNYSTPHALPNPQILSPKNKRNLRNNVRISFEIFL
jgi:hypothetical protein